MREFIVSYLKRLVVVLPIVGIVVWIPPYPLAAKIQSTLLMVVIVLIVQLVTLLVVLHNENVRHKQDLIDAQAEASDEDGAVSPLMSRKSRRRQARIDAARAELDRQ